MVWMLLLLLFQADQFSVEVQQPAVVPAFVVESQQQPSIKFESVPKAASPKPYFALFYAPNCGPCNRMKSESVEESLINAGYQVVVVDLATDPQPTVKAGPEVWLCSPDRKPIRKWKGYVSAKTLLSPTTAEGLCRLSSNGSRWSGVAIGDGLILTVAHHDKTEGFVAEFPVSFGASDYVQIPAELVKSDKDADLSVLRFTAPELIQVKPYAVSELPGNAIEIPGYLSGEFPKRVKIRKKNQLTRVAGIAIDSYDGEGISSPQIGMSGSPLLTPAREVAGIQAIGSGSEIGAVTVETIRKFLADVDREDKSPVAATIHGAQLNPDVIAAALATHLAEQSGAEPPAFGSLFNVSIDVPDGARNWIADLLTAQSVEFPSSGVAVSWKGSNRTISVAPGRIGIKPGASVSVTKFRVEVTASLDAVAYADDLSWVTLELGGAPDLTIRLK